MLPHPWLKGIEKKILGYSRRLVRGKVKNHCSRSASSARGGSSQ